MEEPALTQARESALRFLAYRPRSEAEVRRRLLRRFPPPVVDAVVQRLKEHQLLDDASFAGQWRRDREQHHPKAKGMVRQELRRLGVPAEVAENALEGFDNAANAYRAGQRWARRLEHVQEGEFRQRMGEHLRRRGFGYALAMQTAARLWAELADPLHRDDHTNDDEQQAPDIEPKGPHYPTN